MSTATLSANAAILWNGTNFVINAVTFAPPLTIINSASPTVITCTLTFSAALAATTNAIIFGSSNIILDGAGTSANVTVAAYPGFVNATGAFTGNTVQNLTITASGAGALLANGGWLVQTGSQYVIVKNCFSTGAITAGSGGIVGSAAVGATISCSGSSGAIAANAGGILGQNSTVACSLTNCYSTGAITSTGGGLIGLTANATTAKYCFSIGAIGVDSGGIFAGVDTNCSAISCYSLGAIANAAGGIYGISATTCSALNCYSASPTIGTTSGGGGIYGDDPLTCTATSCYSVGTLGTNAGSIFGQTSATCTATNDYVLQGTLTTLFGGTPTSPTTTNCFAEAGAGWSDVHATQTLAVNDPSAWFSVTPNTPWLLSGATSCWTTPPAGTAAPVQTLVVAGVYNNLTGFYAGAAPVPPNPLLFYGYALVSLNIPPPVPPSHAPFRQFNNGSNMTTAQWILAIFAIIVLLLILIAFFFMF